MQFFALDFGFAATLLYICGSATILKPVHIWGTPYECQRRMAETVAGVLLKSMTEGDLATTMFLAKQYGSFFGQILMQTVTGVEEIQDTEGMPALENLSPDEQLMFLNLLRKAKNPQATEAVVNYTPTQFIEEDEFDEELEDIEEDE